MTQAPIEKAVSYYDSFNPRGFSPAVRSGEICKASSGSLFKGNACFDTRPLSAITQAYGYNKVGNGLKDIKQIGNDSNRKRKGAAKHFSAGAQTPISPEMKSRLKALADDADVPAGARRVLREYLGR